jgi:antibiotic biosynthesis monooxygenase (ABM) superfamily enzyme
MQRPPARYKMAILTAFSVFTLVNVYSWLLSGLLTGLPPLLRSLIVIILVVLSLTYVVMPGLTKLFRPWLFSEK